MGWLGWHLDCSQRHYLEGSVSVDSGIHLDYLDIHFREVLDAVGSHRVDDHHCSRQFDDHHCSHPVDDHHYNHPGDDHHGLHCDTAGAEGGYADCDDNLVLFNGNLM